MHVDLVVDVRVNYPATARDIRDPGITAPWQVEVLGPVLQYETYGGDRLRMGAERAHVQPPQRVGGGKNSVHVGHHKGNR